MRSINFRKIIKTFILTILMVISFISLGKVEAETVPSVIQMGNGKQLPGYIDGKTFSTKVTSDGTYAYCTKSALLTPNGLEMNLVEAKDAGITYIMKNGYPAKSITGNKDYDFYITQSALWWYLDDTTGSDNLSESFKTTGSDPYGLRVHVKELLSGAKKAQSDGYVSPKITFSSNSYGFTKSTDGKYYYSDKVVVNGTGISGKITLTLKGAPSGSSIINNDGKKQESFNSGDTFRIQIPVANVNGVLSAVTVEAEAKGESEKTYEYEPSNDIYQPVVLATIYRTTSNVKASKIFKLNAAQLSVLKADADTGKPVAGAKLQVKTLDGDVVAEWTTTTEEHIINLPEGYYRLSEVAAPDGYELSSDVLNVVLTDGVITKVTFYNTKKVEKETTKLVIIKRDAKTNATLAGANFVLKNSKGEVVSTWTSTTNGHYLTGLPEGEYTIEETSAPAGYIKSDEIKKVVLENGKTVTVTFYNEKEEEEEKPGVSVVRIMKIDGETGNALSGATLVLKDANGNVVATWITTKDAYVIEGLEPGTYYLSEVEAPDGYVLSTEVVEINVIEGDFTQMITFNNIPEVEVPNTNSTISIAAIIVGIVAMGIGGSIIYINGKKQ